MTLQNLAVIRRLRLPVRITNMSRNAVETGFSGLISRSSHGTSGVQAGAARRMRSLAEEGSTVRSKVSDQLPQITFFVDTSAIFRAMTNLITPLKKSANSCVKSSCSCKFLASLREDTKRKQFQ